MTPFSLSLPLATREPVASIPATVASSWLGEARRVEGSLDEREWDPIVFALFGGRSGVGSPGDREVADRAEGE